MDVHSGVGGYAPLPRPPCRRAFASLRFDDVVPAEAEKLRVVLEARGVSLQIVNMKGGGDIDAAVQHGIKSCDTFIIFGTAKYGENTGNMACTYYESKFAWDQKKRIILIRMIPFDQQYEFEQAQFLFGLNLLVLPWMLGAPMPSDLADKIVEAMEIDRVAPQLPEPQRSPQQGLADGRAVVDAWPKELAELTGIPSFAACLAELGVRSIADFGENVDLDEGHGDMLKAVVEQLPSKPKKNRALKVRAQKVLSDLLLRLAIFEELDADGDCRLDSSECRALAAAKVERVSDGSSLTESFGEITAGSEDGTIDFAVFFCNFRVLNEEGVPPAAAVTEPEPEPVTDYPIPTAVPTPETEQVSEITKDGKAVGFTLMGHPAPSFNGLYRKVSEHKGWPVLKNA
eukprot:COSAG02_NODE_670_length_18676_cov_29.852029_1_plen_399_part_10